MYRPYIGEMQMTVTCLKKRHVAVQLGLCILAAISAGAQVDVLTQHNDNTRTGVNLRETVLRRRSPPELRRSPPAPRPARGSAAQTSPDRRSSPSARSPSRSCSRPCNGAQLATARRSAWPCGVACAGAACRLRESHQSRPATDPASAAEQASAAGNQAAPYTPTSCPPSCAPAQTPAPPPAGSYPPPTPPVAPLRITPPSSCLLYSTENTYPVSAEPASALQRNLLVRETSDWRGGLLLLRHVTPLTRRHVVYFCSGAYTSCRPMSVGS